MIEIKKFFIKEKRNLIILLLVIVVATVLRLYNFEEWFQFKNDQARDALNASRVLDEGLGGLRLLGPKAAGSLLYLGPIFYYFQAFSSWIFQSEEPFVMAYPDLLFSILTVPLLYFFIRNFFTNKTSLAISVLYSCSFVVVQYSRFAWNPNSLSFWSLLLVFSLYKISTLKDKQQAGWFLVLTGLAYAVASQLHFIALLGFPLMIFIFWIKYFPKKINWKFWIGSILIVFILYVPVFASEIITRGNNVQHFIETVNQRSEDEKGFLKKVNKTFENYGKYYSFFLTSLNDNEVKNVYFLGELFVAFSIIFLVLVWKNKILRIESKNKRIFLYLIFAYFLGFMIINYKVSHDINRPRFWFSQSIIPFVFFGFFLDLFFKSSKKYSTSIGLVVLSILLILNLTATLNSFFILNKQEESSYFKRIRSSTAKRFYQPIGIFDEHKIVDYIYEKIEGDRVCLNAPSDYGRVYEYIFHLKYPQIKVLRTEHFISYDLRNNCSLFLITNKERNKDEQNDSMHMDFEIKSSFYSGVISAYEIDPLDNDLSHEYKLEFERDQEAISIENEEEKEVSIESIPVKVWADFFNR